MEKLVLNSDRSLELIQCDEPVCPEDGFIVKTMYCGICSTDIKMIRSGQKDLTYPRVLGHEIIGGGLMGILQALTVRSYGVKEVFLVDLTDRSEDLELKGVTKITAADENEEYNIIQNISPDIAFIATSAFTFDNRLIESTVDGSRVLLFSGFLDDKKSSLPAQS